MSLPGRVASGFVLATFCALSGCNKADASAAGALAAASAVAAVSAALPASAAAAAPKIDPEEERDAALSEKISHYIECINDTDSYLHGTYDNLLESLTPKREVNPRRWPNLRATSTLRDRCYKGLDEAAKLQPKLDDLEQAGAAFRAAVDKLEPLLVDGDHYYHQGDDKDDKGAHGKAVVKLVLAGFDEFNVASKALRAAVEKYNEGILSNSLKRVEKAEGRSVHFLCKKVVADAKLAIDEFLDEKAELSKLEATLESYKKLDAELRERSEKFPKEKERVSGLSGVTARSDFVLRDLKETVRALKAKKPELAQGARQSLLKSYNELITESNKLEFKEG
jgi:hypothetical protein